ncbi:ATP-grasp domain-containing protein [Patescibacteria group bacterium]|nr:ATP-grasp domain-containing protein [Patescibacteria group bacterium]MDE1946790.1 ATP-grasp domain-containing protein [Patescibacteria group bacterium]MDE2011078.1 ATP-grasp domain-containing protein [Patescibacteria group bacterium]MDE2233135.1 ATP-grasp domain-containing protein [Patescibacteria group bacterium]
MQPFKKKIVYVTRDAERAQGVPESDDYKIISNDSSRRDSRPLSTAELLQLDSTRKIIGNSGAAVLVFKNNSQIEDICNKNGWELLNPSAALAEKIENKITQVEWLGDLALKYLPAHKIAPTKDLHMSDMCKSSKMVVQWAHGHTGDGTVSIGSAEELRAVQEKFTERPARAMTFVAGPSFTANVVAAKNKIMVGNVSYQITGMAPFTDNPFSTVGNDWGAAHTILADNEIAQIETIAREIGERMRADGWRGLFGVDAIKDEQSGRIFLIEINARQPASATFESQLQSLPRSDLSSTSKSDLSIFEAHLLALLEQPIDQPLIKISDGGQIIQRVTKDTVEVPANAISAMESAGYKTTVYSNVKINSDLLRIRSIHSFVESHGKLNKSGKEIAEIIKQRP